MPNVTYHIEWCWNAFQWLQACKVFSKNMSAVVNDVALYCMLNATEPELTHHWELSCLQKCNICGKGKKSLNGATAGCAIQTCRKTFHFYCARTTLTTVARKMVETMDDGNELDRYLWVPRPLASLAPNWLTVAGKPGKLGIWKQSGKLCCC